MELLYQPGAIIEQRYRLKEVLGQGGSGTTYKAQNLVTNQLVAIKILSFRHLKDWKQLELFEREAQVLAQLNHPHIPRYLDYFAVDDSFCIVQELAPGKSLAELIAEGKRFSEAEVKDIAIQILETLVYLHSQKPPVIHRDIKPENIIVGNREKERQEAIGNRQEKQAEDFGEILTVSTSKQSKDNHVSNSSHLKKWRKGKNQVFLVDFGAVQNTYHSTLARGSTVVGTFGYMAPEQFIGQAVPASDLYGLGTTLLFLLTHRSPAELPTQELSIDVRVCTQVSEHLTAWLEKTVEADVADRFGSAKQALAQLMKKNQQKLVLSSGIKWQGLVVVAIGTIAASWLIMQLPFYLTAKLGLFPQGVYDAIEEGNVERVEEYLETGVDPDLKTEKGEFKHLSLLYYAVEQNQKEIAEVLISRGADVNLTGRYQTPLHIAATRGYEEIAQLLVTHGADVNFVEKQNGYTPLHYAAWHGHREIAELLINQGSDVNAATYSGFTPLHLAAGRDYHQTVELLINQGSELSPVDQWGETPLGRVAKRGHQTTTELLKSHGAR